MDWGQGQLRGVELLKFLSCFEDAEEWDRLVKTKDPHFSAAYYRAYGDGRLACLYVSNMDMLVVQPFRLQENGWIGNAFNYGGPLGDPGVLPMFRSAFEGWKTEHNLNERCKVSPFLGQLSQQIVEIKPVVVVNLHDPRVVRRGARRCIEKAELAGMTSGPVEPTVVNCILFESLYRDVMIRKAADKHWIYPAGFFSKVLTELGPDRSVLFLTRVKDKVVGGGVMIFCPDVCYYHWTARDENTPNVEHLQAWRAIEWAAGQGMNWFHFGGGLQGEDGLLGFKAAFSDIRMTCRGYTTYAKKAA